MRNKAFWIVCLFAMMSIFTVMACDDETTSTLQNDDDDDDDDDVNDDDDDMDDDDDDMDDDDDDVTDDDDDDDDDDACEEGETRCTEDGMAVERCFEGSWLSRDCEDGQVCEEGACTAASDDDDDDDDDDVTDDDDDTTDDDDDVTDDDDDDDVNFTEGFSYRADALAIFSPEMAMQGVGDVKVMLNNQITQRIQSGELNFLFNMQADDLQSYPYNAYFGIGEAQGENYTFQTDSSYYVEVIQDPDETDTAYFISQTTEIPIPIQQGMEVTLYDATFQGKYNIASESIESGIIAGAIKQSDAASIVVYGQITLDYVFNMLGITPDHTFSDNTQGYSFIFTYSAQGVMIVE